MKAVRIGLAGCRFEVSQRHGVKIVVGERDKPKSQAAQLHYLTDDGVNTALTRFLTICAPHRAKRAVLGTAAHRLHRSPHVPFTLQEIPAGRQELIAPNTATLINTFRLAVCTVLDNARPNQIAVAANNRVSAANFMSFIRKKRGVNPSKNDPRTASARFSPNFVASKRVAGVQPNTNDIASLNGCRVNRLKRLIDDQRVSPHPRSSCGKNIQPPGSDNSHTKRHMAGIY